MPVCLTVKYACCGPAVAKGRTPLGPRPKSTSRACYYYYYLSLYCYYYDHQLRLVLDGGEGWAVLLDDVHNSSWHARDAADSGPPWPRHRSTHRRRHHEALQTLDRLDLDTDRPTEEDIMKRFGLWTALTSTQIDPLKKTSWSASDSGPPWPRHRSTHRRRHHEALQTLDRLDLDTDRPTEEDIMKRCRLWTALTSTQIDPLKKTSWSASDWTKSFVVESWAAGRESSQRFGLSSTSLTRPLPLRSVFLTRRSWQTSM